MIVSSAIVEPIFNLRLSLKRLYPGQCFFEEKLKHRPAAGGNEIKRVQKPVRAQERHRVSATDDAQRTAFPYRLRERDARLFKTGFLVVAKRCVPDDKTRGARELL